jgi:hypothetical protein
LLKFLHWRGLGIDVFQATVIHDPSRLVLNLNAPVAPATLDPRALDAFHAAMWLQTMCIVEPSSSQNQELFYTSYSQYCMLNLLNPVPLPELLKLCVKFYQEQSVSFETGTVLGLKPKVDLSKLTTTIVEPVDFKCRIEDCEQVCENAVELWEHVKTHTISTLCSWSSCKRKFKSKDLLLQHLCTHLPMDSTKSGKNETLLPPGIHTHTHEELRGIPLCALLVIRNIARNPQNHLYFAPFEKDLATMLTNPKLNKTVANILAELK